MKKQEKIFTVQNLTEKLKDAKMVTLADYRGLTVSQMGQIRDLVRKDGGEMTVIKNTLLKRALQEAGLLPTDKDLTDEDLGLTGPTAVVIAYEDELAPLKTIANFSKTNSLPTFKTGVLEGQLLFKEDIERLSRLPGKQDLQAKLVGLLSSPAFRLVQVLSANQGKLLFILKTKSERG